MFLKRGLTMIGSISCVLYLLFLCGCCVVDTQCNTRYCLVPRIIQYQDELQSSGTRTIILIWYLVPYVFLLHGDFLTASWRSAVAAWYCCIYTRCSSVVCAILSQPHQPMHRCRSEGHWWMRTIATRQAVNSGPRRIHTSYRIIGTSTPTALFT